MESYKLIIQLMKVNSQNKFKAKIQVKNREVFGSEIGKVFFKLFVYKINLI